MGKREIRWLLQELPKLRDADVLDDDVKRLYRTGYFNDVETHVISIAGGAQVTVIVVENQIVSRVVFEGRKRVARPDVLAVVETREGDFLDPATLVQAEPPEAAVFVSEFCSPRLKEALKILIELLAAIPSVV